MPNDEAGEPDREQAGDGMSAAAAPVVPAEGEAPEAKDFQFTVTLYGGRLATVKVPIPMTSGT